MKREFEVRLELKKILLSRTSISALRHLERYDAVLLTSRNAKRFFMEELRRRHLKEPRHIIQVGPRNELLTFDLKGKKLLFPRSEFAPADIVRKLRAKGATVRTVPLYTVKRARLSKQEKKLLLSGKITSLYVKSPSGVQGLLRYFRGRERAAVLTIPVRCIGETTALAARSAGFRHVSIR
jgi:uroporphyrinogen-III synthase